MVRQVNKEYTAKDERMEAYQKVAQSRMTEFEEISLNKIPREQNTEADKLALAASGWPDAQTVTKIEEILQPSTSEKGQPRTVMQVESIPNDWQGWIMNYLEYRIQPGNPTEARKLRMKAGRYIMIEGELFRRSFSGPHLRCLGSNQAQLVLKEIHEGSCGYHAG